MKFLKSTLCCLLTLLILAALFPFATFQVSAATTPATVTVAQAQQRLQTLVNTLNGVYFTVNRNACGTGLSSHSCSNCLLSSIISASWLRNALLVPDNVNYCPVQYDPADGLPFTPNGYSCYGFANYAHWYVFAQRGSDNLTSQHIATGLFSYSFLSTYAKPGDVLRSSGHSMVLISFDQNGATVMDCNEYTREPNRYNCKVQVYYKTYSSYNRTVTLNGVANYDRGSGAFTPSISFDITKPSTYPAYPGATLREGASGDYVRFIQTALNDLGYNCGTVNGTYGASTTSAVKAFQSQHGLTSDGLCGQWTYAEILSVLTAKYNHAHNYSSSAVTRAATCSQSGVRTYYCSCGATKTEGIPATGHSWGSWVTTKQPTSDSTGTAKRTCTKCSGYETKTLAKRPAVKITGYSNNLLAAKNKTAKISVKAEGDGLVYKWYYKNKGDKKFTRTYSFSGPTYSVQMTSARDGRQVYCIVEDEYGNYVATAIFTLKLQNVVKIKTQPKSVTVAKNKTAKVTVKATGDGLIYKWYYKDKGASKFTRTYSFKGATYSVQMNAKRSGRQIYCVVEDAYGNYLATKIVTIKMK